MVLEQSFLQLLLKEHQDTPNCPSNKEVSNWVMALISFLFPGFSEEKIKELNVLQLTYTDLNNQLTKILVGNYSSNTQSAELSKQFFSTLPKLKEMLDKDALAIFKGDPAAKSVLEVVRTYPGFFAIANHRIAYELHSLGVDLIPRMISEQAHSKTGIDIHPGAKIGAYFFIDHGTGVVIGETTKIGNWVKVYQGVTLGALSVEKNKANIQRHPTVEDEVVIYSGATILGGKTIIGKGSIIGGSVWLTQSVEPYAKVYYKAKMSNQSGDVDTITFK